VEKIFEGYNMMGPGFLALGLGLILLMLVFVVAVYVYTALALSTIAKKLGHDKPWLAWIPVVNIALVLQMGGFHWAWTFLVFIPILGWVPLAILSLVAMWRIYELRNYPGWLALVSLLGFIPILGGLAGIANLVVLGFVAWKDR
jgi:hypothetical protein